MIHTQDNQNRRTRSSLIVLMGAAALTLAACSGTGSATNYIPASTPPSQSQRAPQGAVGTIAAVTASNVEVQSPQNQVTVNFDSSTTFDTVVQATRQDLTVGSCVVVMPAPNAPAGQPVPAATVVISQPDANGCMRGGGFAPGGGGPGGGANPSRSVRPSGQPPNGPPPNAARGAFGSVNAVNGNTITVHSATAGNGNAQANGNAPADTMVTVDSNTMFTKSVPADSHALAVGKCAMAVGPTNNTGAVSARSITISSPGPNGCAAVGGRQGQGRGGRNGGGNG